MQRRVDNTRNVIYCHCMGRMVSYPGITRTVLVHLKWPIDDTSRGCSVEKQREQSLHSLCSSLMPIRTSVNRGCLAKELRVSLSKA
jgi:hypothetical protein